MSSRAYWMRKYEGKWTTERWFICIVDANNRRNIKIDEIDENKEI